MKLLPTIAILLQFTLNASVTFGQDFSSKNLFPVYGKKNHLGKSDCDASVNVTSKGDQILIQIAVKDDKVVLNDNIMESDHVEVWFNMDTLFNDYFVYNKIFYGGDSITKEKKEAFISYITGEEYDTENSNTQRTIEAKDIPIVKEINGMVHWGFDLQKGTSSLFDQEFYLKLPVSDSVKARVSFQKQLVKGGYNVTLAFQPEALLFFRKNVVDDLVFMVDVFDVDQSSKDLSVLSTAQHRRWGAPEVFTRTKLKTPLKVTQDLNPFKIELPLSFYFYKGGRWHYFYRRENKERWFDEFFTYDYKELIPKKTSETPADTATATIYTYEVEPQEGYKGIIKKIVFKNQVFGYGSYGCEESNYKIRKVKEGEYAIHTVSCYYKNPWGSGECGACVFIDEAFYLLKNGGLYKTLDFTYSEDGQRIILMDDYKNADLISHDWTDNYSSVQIKTREYDYTRDNVPDKCYTYKITWDNAFKPRSEKKEFNCPPAAKK